MKRAVIVCSLTLLCAALPLASLGQSAKTAPTNTKPGPATQKSTAQSPLLRVQTPAAPEIIADYYLNSIHYTVHAGLDRTSLPQASPLEKAYAVSERHPKTLSVYYLNYTTETYVPMEPEQLAKPCYEVIVRKEADRDWLLTTLLEQGAPAKFDVNRIRLALLIPGTSQRILVDAAGVVANGDRQYHLNGIRWEALHNFLATRKPYYRPSDKSLGSLPEVTGVTLWREN